MIRFSLQRESVLQTQDKYSITFCIDSQLNQIGLIRAALSGVLNHLGVAESDVFSLELAVTEIITNTLEHGYKGATDKSVEVCLKIIDREVRIELTDNAPAFPADQLYRINEARHPIEDATEDWPMRGHGLQIVRQIVDSIELRTEENRNHMTITKHVSLEKN